MKSFILALLPGLEEETGEFFDKVGYYHMAQTSVAHTTIIGAKPTRSVVGNCVPRIFYPEHVGHYDHNVFCTGNRFELPLPPSTSITCRRR